MKIEKASLADIPAICMLVNGAYRGDTSRKGWTTEADLLDGIRIDEMMLKEYLNDIHSTILKCTDGEGNIRGCVYIKKNADQLYLGMLTVCPGMQNLGIGKKLLQASEELAAVEKCVSVQMTVITNRTELIDWYKRNGFAETGERQPFPTSERFGIPRQKLEFLVMQKTL